MRLRAISSVDSLVMKTVRFAAVVAASGKPEIHLLLMEPGKDSQLQRAIKANQVMTIHQSAVGTKADYGTIGFEKTLGQFLIFPKSLKRFEDRRVVGINFDLTNDAAGRKVPVNLAAVFSSKSSQKKFRRRLSPILPFEPSAASNRISPATRPQREAARTKATKDGRAPIPVKNDGELRMVRRALAFMERGKSVAAHNLLKKAVATKRV